MTLASTKSLVTYQLSAIFTYPLVLSPLSALLKKSREASRTNTSKSCIGIGGNPEEGNAIFFARLMSRIRKKRKKRKRKKTVAL